MGACWWLLSLDQTQRTGHFGLQTKSPLFFSPLKGKKNPQNREREFIHDLAYIAAVFGHGCKVDMSIARYRNCWKRGLSGLAAPWQREAGGPGRDRVLLQKCGCGSGGMWPGHGGSGSANLRPCPSWKLLLTCV